MSVVAEPPTLEDFDGRTNLVLASSELDDAGMVPICRLAYRCSDGGVRRLELTSEQLDDLIETLEAMDKAMGAEIEKAAAATEAP